MRAISRGRDPVDYSIWFPFFLSATGALDEVQGPDTPASIMIGGHSGSLHNEGFHYVLRVPGFPSYEEAARFALTLGTGLILFVLERRVGVRFSEPPLEPAGTRFSIGTLLKGATDLSWDVLHDEGKPPMFEVEGVIDTFRPYVIPEHRKIVTSGSVQFDPVWLHGRGLLARSIDEACSLEAPGRVFTEERLLLALGAFSTAYSTHLPTMRFLNLFTSLETLSEPRGCGEVVGAVLDEMIALVGDRKRGSPSAASELDSLKMRLGSLRQTSIRDAMSELITPYAATPPGESWPSGSQTTRNAVERIYRIRNRLVHSGQMGDENDFRDCLSSLETIAARILRRRLIATCGGVAKPRA